MSDELRAGEEAQKDKGVSDHRCEHPGCAEWGSWGYQRSKLEATRWYCYGHRETGERLIRRVA